MLKGNPYISANRATINAEKAPSDRQSRVVRGRVKLSPPPYSIGRVVIHQRCPLQCWVKWFVSSVRRGLIQSKGGKNNTWEVEGRSNHPPNLTHQLSGKMDDLVPAVNRRCIEHDWKVKAMCQHACQPLHVTWNFHGCPPHVVSKRLMIAKRFCLVW